MFSRLNEDMPLDGRLEIINMADIQNDMSNEYFVVKALENGVDIIGLTRGRDTRFHHTEKLGDGEVYIAQFTETTSAVKVRGRADIYTKYGVIKCGQEEIN